MTWNIGRQMVTDPDARLICQVTGQDDLAGVPRPLAALHGEPIDSCIWTWATDDCQIPWQWN